MVDTNSGSYRPVWKNRRRTIFGSLIWSMFVVAACLFIRGIDPEVAKVAIMSHVILSAGVIGSYVFGAVWDDKNVLDKIAGLK